MNIPEFLRLAQQLDDLIDTGVSWELKYDVGFEHIKPLIGATGVNIEWCDPDMGYDDDILAYNNAVQEKAEELAPIAGLLDQNDEIQRLRIALEQISALGWVISEAGTGWVKPTSPSDLLIQAQKIARQALK